MIADLTVTFADTAAATLAWSLGGERRPALASAVVPLPNGAVLGLHVVGSSHQTVLDHDGQQLLETVACPLDGEAHARDRLPASARSATALGAYAFSSVVSRHSDAALAREVDAVCAQLEGRSDAVIARFPGSAQAITALVAEVDPVSVGWHTWHAYPQTGELVVTASRLHW